MSRTRGVAYPSRNLGRWLEQAVQKKIAEEGGPDSAVAVTRWLGHAEPTRMNKWIKGRLLPKPEDYPALSRLGLSEEQIHALVVRDRMQVLALDEGLDDKELHKTAAIIARAAGISMEELIRTLREVDLEALERALESS